MLAPWKKNYNQPRQHIKKQKHHFANKFCVVKAIFSIVMYRCGSWAIKKAECGWIDAFELCWRRLESPLDNKIKPVNPKGNQPWIFVGRRTDAEAEAPVFGPSEANSRLIGKDPDIGKDWRQKEKRATEDEMVGCHHWFSGHELGQTPGDGEGWWSLACCSPRGCKELDVTWWLNNSTPAVQKWRHLTEDRLTDMAGVGGRRGWDVWRTYTETYIAMYVASGNLLCDSGSSYWGLVNLVGWGGRWEGCSSGREHG